MTLVNTLNITASYSDQSLFLSDAEIDRFLLIDLDIDSMNEALEYETVPE